MSFQLRWAKNPINIRNRYHHLFLHTCILMWAFHILCHLMHCPRQRNSSYRLCLQNGSLGPWPWRILPACTCPAGLVGRSPGGSRGHTVYKGSKFDTKATPPHFLFLYQGKPKQSKHIKGIHKYNCYFQMRHA